MLEIKENIQQKVRCCTSKDNNLRNDLIFPDLRTERRHSDPTGNLSISPDLSTFRPLKWARVRTICDFKFNTAAYPTLDLANS